MIEIEATNYCNTHCIHCPRESITRPMGKMDWLTFRTIVDRITSDSTPDLVNFSGMGEPTMNPLLPDFVGYLSPRVSAVQVTTNASNLGYDLIVDLIDAGLDKLFISFNGHVEDLYKTMMGGLSLERVTENIKCFFSLAQGKVQVLANVSVTKLNRDCLPEIKEYLQDLGVQDIFFSQCHNRGGHFLDSSVCSTSMPPFSENYCDVFADTLFVTWNGKVLSCCHDLKGEATVGDLNTESMDQIFTKKRAVIQEGVNFPMCKDCNDLYRFMGAPTPDGSPLSRWIYELYAEEDERAAKLVEVIDRRNQRIRELEQLVLEYERGWCIKTINWLRKTFCK